MKVRDCGFNEIDFEDLELIHEDKVKLQKPRQTRRTHFCVEETLNPTNISYDFISIFWSSLFFLFFSLISRSLSSSCVILIHPFYVS